MPNRRFNKQVPGHGYKGGGQVNKSIVNRLEELGRVDAERGRSRKGIKNLRDEKKRIIKEIMGRKPKPGKIYQKLKAQQGRG